MVAPDSQLASISDAELTRRVTSGDRPAEGELCRRFAPRIRLYGLRHLRTEDAARDLVQSVLIAVIVAMRADRIEAPERIDRFVLGTCRHLALRARHSASRAEPRAPDDLEIASAFPSFEILDVPALLHCMERLDARARSVLHMAFYRDKSADEIARALATSPGNVRVVRHRAMAALRGCLDRTEVS